MLEQLGFEDPQSFWSKFNLSAMRQALDDELAAMHLSMCALRTRRNALAPISKLPPEVLARIFKHHADKQPAFGREQPRLGWIQVTHVCSHWRITALQQPYLWGHIDSSVDSEWQELILYRARTLPVSFRNSNCTSENGLIAKHLFHICDLALFYGDRKTLEHFLPTLTSSAPLLESFQLCSLSPSSRHPNLPLNVLNGHSPRLRQLILHNVLVPWSASILQNLTVLSVRCNISGEAEARNESSTAISRHSHLIEALEKMPALESLSLEHCLPPQFPSPASNQVIDLRQLRRLYMHDASDRCTGVLKHLRVPSSCSLAFDMKGPADIHDILPFLHAYAVDGGGETPFQTLALTFDRENFTVAIWRTYLETDIKNSFKPRSDPDVRIQFIHPGNSSDVAQTLCRALPLDNLRRLSIYNSHPAWSSQDWVDTFGRCTALENILLDGRNAVHYCRGLLQPDHTPLLSLRSLWLSGINFHDDVIHGAGGISVFHRAFLAWLAARKERGPLFKLIIKECQVTQAYVTELRQILEVEWK